MSKQPWEFALERVDTLTQQLVDGLNSSAQTYHFLTSKFDRSLNSPENPPWRLQQKGGYFILLGEEIDGQDRFYQMENGFSALFALEANAAKQQWQDAQVACGIKMGIRKAFIEQLKATQPTYKPNIQRQLAVAYQGLESCIKQHYADAFPTKEFSLSYYQTAHELTTYQTFDRVFARHLQHLHEVEPKRQGIS